VRLPVHHSKSQDATHRLEHMTLVNDGTYIYHKDDATIVQLIEIKSNIIVFLLFIERLRTGYFKRVNHTQNSEIGMR